MKKLIIMAITLIMVLSFTACNGETAEEEEEEIIGEELPSAQEIIDGVTEALASTRSYQFDMNMTVDTSGEAEGEAFNMSMDMDGTGAIDLDKKEMMMNMTMNMVVPGEDEIDMDTAMYLIGDTIYMQMTNPLFGGPPMWMKFEVPEESWGDMSSQIDQLGLLSEMFEMGEMGEVKVTGSASVAGIDCYTVEIIPDIEQLWQLVMEQMQLSEQTTDIPEMTVENFPDILKSYSIKHWVAKDTYHIAKMEMAMEMQMTPEDMGLPEEEGAVNMKMKMSMLIYDYNQPVNVILPPEAEDAVEVPMPEA